MSRLPFDAGRARGAESSKPPEGPWTVSQLSSAVSDALDRSLPARVSVVGEVSQPRLSTHLYFTLKDAHAGIQGVVFSSTLRRMGQAPEHGQQVVAHGKVSYFAPQGRVSLIIDRIERIGQGALEQRLRELADELRALGWFEEQRKRTPPTLPRRVAVITSPTGAALQDVLDTLRRRCPAVDVLVVGVKVQGEAAASQVSRAVRWISSEHQRLGIDAVIVTRGGGSLEDLWAFNDRELARAVLECRVPVVAAIGHETDTTIIELVADVRAATPTQAAMRVAPDAQALLGQIVQLHERLGLGLRRSLRDARARLEWAATQSVLADPHALMEPSRQRIELARRDLRRAMRSGLIRARARVEQIANRLERHRPAAIHAARRERWKGALMRLRTAQQHALRGMVLEWASMSRELEAVGPRSVLHRGFTCTLNPSGKAVRSSGQVQPGDLVRTITADGSFESTVGHAREKGGGIGGRPAVARIRRRSTPIPGSPAQPGLFEGESEQERSQGG